MEELYKKDIDTEIDDRPDKESKGLEYVNGANFLENTKFASLAYLGDKDNGEEFLVTIKDGKKLSEAVDRLPYGILNKTITGLGATTLEITTQHRNSIIVVPTKTLAYTKTKQTNEELGEDYAFYVGSPINGTREISLDDIKRYLEKENGKKRSF